MKRQEIEMILTDCRVPENYERDVAQAAFHLCDTSRSLTGASLCQYLPTTGEAALGLQVSLRFYKEGGYRSAQFELAPTQDLEMAHAFHVFVPFSQGYDKAKTELLEAARIHWFQLEASRVLESHGRILGNLEDDELHAMYESRRYRSYIWVRCPLDRNACLGSELARREIEARQRDSNHSRLHAIQAAKQFLAFRAKEDERSLRWWQNLAPADRKYLPEYEIDKLPEVQKALFTYRNYLAERTRPGAVSKQLLVREKKCGAKTN